MGILNILTNQVSSNVGMSFEHIILLIFVVGGFLFYAKSVQLGLIIQFVGSACIFMWMYQANLNWVPALLVMFMSLVVMIFSLYFGNKVSETGGFS